MSISLTDVSKSFGAETAVDGLSAEVARGEFFVVLGPSGCGKSTLLRLIAGLETLDNGSVALDGHAVAGPDLHLAPEDRQVGVVFQSYALWPHMTVTRNVAFPIESASGRREAERDALEHLGTVELTAYAARRPAELSGGQRQRVALARCLASGARTILMDEPLANLDPHLRGAMEHELKSFHRQSGATTLYITHDQREAMALADRIAVMRDGRFEQVAAPHEVYARPASAFVAGFIGSGGIVQGEVTAAGDGRASARIAGLELDLDCIDDVTSGPVQVLIRPEWLSEDPDRGIECTVTAVSYRGGVWECQSSLPSGSGAWIYRSGRPVSEGEILKLHPGQGWVLPR
ncbi:MAG: ABC transporter ATP-binding protein [Minwuia sp.]|uniref:ABC transporter ATP-binding protein n=1 Tax=Minwuia sp. TaxID=2493630 RepID=UPI003A8A9A62